MYLKENYSRKNMQRQINQSTIYAKILATCDDDESKQFIRNSMPSTIYNEIFMNGRQTSRAARIKCLYIHYWSSLLARFIYLLLTKIIYTTRSIYYMMTVASISHNVYSVQYILYIYNRIFNIHTPMYIWKLNMYIHIVFKHQDLYCQIAVCKLMFQYIINSDQI